MPALDQCSVCETPLPAAGGGSVGAPGDTQPDGPPRRHPTLFFAGRVHRFCPGSACLLTFKRDPQRYATAGRPVAPGDGPPGVPVPRPERAPSPFAVRARPAASEPPDPPDA